MFQNQVSTCEVWAWLKLEACQLTWSLDSSRELGAFLAVKLALRHGSFQTTGAPQKSTHVL